MYFIFKSYFSCKNRLVFVFILLLFYTPKSFSAENDSIPVIDYIFNFDFKSADNELKKGSSDNLVINHVLGLEMKWWEAMESGSYEDLDDFLACLDRFETLHTDDFSKVIILTYRLRYFALKGEKIKIPLTLFSINNNLSKISAEEINNYEPVYREMLSLYRSFFNLITYNYSIERFISGTNGKKMIIGEIEEIVNNGYNVNKTLGRYFLMKYYLEIDCNKPKANDYLVVLHKQFPGNTIFNTLLTI